MKNKKRWFGLVLIIGVLAIAPMTVSAASAGPPVQIAVGSPAQEVEAGAEFTVPITISGNPGFGGATFQIDYNENALDLVGVNGTGGILPGAPMFNAEAALVGYISFSDNVTGDGTLFNVTFKAKSGAVTGDYALSIALKDNTNKNFVTKDAEEVPVAFTPGTVQIDGVPAPGDGGTPGGGNPDGGTGGTPGGNTPGSGTGGTPGGGTPGTAIDVNAPSGSGANTGTVGRPIFVNAEEGRLTWDPNMFEGQYDPEAGGYTLTPLAPGDTSLSYQNEDGSETPIDVEIRDAETPLTTSEAASSLTIPLIIIAVLVVALILILILFQRKKRADAAGAFDE
jgi:hypothetical protein